MTAASLGVIDLAVGTDYLDEQYRRHQLQRVLPIGKVDRRLGRLQ